MRVRKVRLEDAYLHGCIGFKNYLEGKKNLNKEDSFYKIFLKTYKKISVEGIPPEEVIFYIAGFFDEYEKEKYNRLHTRVPDLELEGEEWVKYLMEDTKTSNIDYLAVNMIHVLMETIENLYIRSDKMKIFIKNRLSIQSSYVGLKYKEMVS